MLLTTLLFTVKTPVHQSHDTKVLGCVRWLGLIGIFATMTAIILIDVYAYSSVASGEVTREFKTSPSRSMSTVDEIRSIKYCQWTNNASVANPMAEVAVSSRHFAAQEAMGRLCLQDITCDRWVGNNEMFLADSEKVFLSSFIVADPIPELQAKLLSDFSATELAPLKSPAYATGTPLQQAAIERAIWGDNYDYMCPPSYFVVRPEELKISIFHAVNTAKFGAVNAPRTIFYSWQGVKIGDFPMGTMPEINIKEMFPVDMLDTSVPFPIEIEGAPAIQLPVRVIGGRGTLIFRYTNELDGSILDEIICIVSVEIFGSPYAPSYNRVTKLRNLVTDQISVERYTHLGFNLRIVDKIEVLTNNYYNIFLHYISVAVLMQEFNALMIIIAMVVFKCSENDKDGDEKNGEGNNNAKQAPVGADDVNEMNCIGASANPMASKPAEGTVVSDIE